MERRERRGERGGGGGRGGGRDARESRGGHLVVPVEPLALNVLAEGLCETLAALDVEGQVVKLLHPACQAAIFSGNRGGGGGDLR
jgi:hypothetical protein